MHLSRFVVYSLFLLTLAAVAVAGPFTSVIVYGDSLSDNGNLFAATGQPGAPYWDGRRSNGPVVVENLAAQFGVALHDFAWSGATTGVGNGADSGTPTTIGAFGLPGMGTEFASTKAVVAPMASTSLFVIWGGPNDFLSPAPEDGGDAFKTADRAVADLMAIITGVQGLGAQHILVPGMPDLGLTPYFQSIGQGASGSFLTDYFNTELAAALGPTGATYFDTASVLRDMVMNPAKYGFTNVNDACFNGTTVCADPSKYLFFDDFHPTAQANVIVADRFAAALVPEPASYVLVASGLAFTVFMSARTGRRRPERRP